MSHSLHILPNGDKQELYNSLIPQLKALIEGETDMIANMANISAALKLAFNFFWVGFYIVRRDELVLGPFQGSLACTRIKYGRGVCGTSWKEQKVIIVPDVDQFSGHIACDSASRSEIVIPLYNELKKVIAVLDIDSDNLNYFDEIDAEYLQKIINILEVEIVSE